MLFCENQTEFVLSTMCTTSVCRTCLARNANKDISDLKAYENTHSCSDVLLFCLNIQIEEDSSVSTKLCVKCYRKITSFYEFKLLALKSDKYLKKLVADSKEVNVWDEIKTETVSPCGSDICNPLFEEEIKIELKTEENHVEVHSDDELLSVIKQIKYENEDETKENEPIKMDNLEDKQAVIENKISQVCEECGKTVRNIKEHLNLHQPKSVRRRIPCKICDKTFASHSARYKHNKVAHLGIKKCCPDCNKYVVNIKQHNLVVHNSSELRYLCVSCSRRFISQSALEAHTIIHTKNRPYQCDVCDKGFRSKMVMEQHKRQVHNKEKLYLCQFCSKSFFKKYHLQVHLRSHTKEKPYECPDCNKWFSSSTTLKNHRMTHSDVKAYSCKLCDMTFLRAGYLSAHMISHTKEKRHPCKYCGVKFGRSDHRKRHEYTAHERHRLPPP